MRRATPFGVAFALIALVAAGASDSITEAPMRAVTMPGKAYEPSHLDVLVGTTVTWKNDDSINHTVTSDADLFDSGEVAASETFARRFDTVGTFPYHCVIHPSITGEIDVRRVTLDPLPPAALPIGRPVELGGRTADPGKAVEIQRLNGPAWSTVASATPSRRSSPSRSPTAMPRLDEMP